MSFKHKFIFTDMPKLIITALLSASSLLVEFLGPFEKKEYITIKTFYNNDLNINNQKWVIDTNHHKITRDENNTSSLIVTFNVDEPNSFFDDCIKPVISSQIGEVFVKQSTNSNIPSTKYRFIFYNKAPYVYLEKGNLITIYAYGYNPSLSYLVPFFRNPASLKHTSDYLYYSNNTNPTLLQYSSLVDNEFSSYITCTNYYEAKQLFVEHLNEEAYKISDVDKTIELYGYKSVTTIESNGEKSEIYSFDKKQVFKYFFRPYDILYVQATYL